MIQAPDGKKVLKHRFKPEVRQAAAKTFDSLHNTVGSRALDDILPPMLKQLEMKHDDEVRTNPPFYAFLRGRLPRNVLPG
jgi:hypothetical protein